MNRVIVKYNPYLPELNVLINGYPLSKYSSIKSYRHKPFVEWCTNFFDEIGSEVNDKYDMNFIGTDFENEIFEKLASENNLCVNYHYEHVEFKQDVYDRLETLEEIGDANPVSEIKVGIWSEDPELVDDFLQLLIQKQEYTPTDENTLVSTEYPLVKITVKKIEFAEDLLSVQIPITLTQGEPGEDLINHIQSLNRSVFLISLGNQSVFKGKKVNIFYYQVKGEEATDRIDEIISGVGLPLILSDRDYKFQKQVDNGTLDLNLTEEDKEKLYQICEVEPIYKVKVPSKAYVDRTFTINVKRIPNNSSVFYAVKSKNSRFRIEGLKITPIKSGDDVLSIYANNSSVPVFSQNISIEDGTFINEMSFNVQQITVPVNEERELQLSYEPRDAVDSDELDWNFSNPGIVEIRDGKLYGVQPGDTTLTVKAQDVEASLNISVLPHIERIELSKDSITLKAGDAQQLNYLVVPANAIEKDSIQIESSNESVAVYRGGRVIARKPGQATIFFKMEEFQCLCNVTVIKKGIF